MNTPQTGTVVLVHGLWFGAWSMRLLGRRLRRAGFATRSFRYRSIRGALDDHAAALSSFASPGAREGPHFVVHSLGGLVTLRMLAGHPELPAGRVVLLGSPLNGSAVASKATRIPGFARMLGGVRPALEAGFTRLPPGWEVGMIAGSRGMGLGLLVGGTSGAGDGTVAVSETRADGLRDHLVLPVTHTGLLFSRAVARQVASFLRSGSFSGTP
jgi:pimeloyl-ACP methyl ester carboxylesterase